MTDPELEERLDQTMGEESGKKKFEHKDPRDEFAHPYPEFSEFSRDQCKAFEDLFASYDSDHDNFISLDEFRHLMESRNDPLTHLELKNLIAAVDEDKDGKLCFREFMLIWAKSYKKEMPEGTGFSKIVNANEKILGKPTDVHKGAGGKVGLFEAKGAEGADTENYEAEIREQQRLKYEKKRKNKEKAEKEKERKAKFAARSGAFGN